MRPVRDLFPWRWHAAAEVVSDLGTYREALRKIAILYCKEPQGDTALFLELFATNRGFPLRALAEEVSAVQWLDAPPSRPYASAGLACATAHPPGDVCGRQHLEMRRTGEDDGQFLPEACGRIELHN